MLVVRLLVEAYHPAAWLPPAAWLQECFTGVVLSVPLAGKGCVLLTSPYRRGANLVCASPTVSASRVHTSYKRQTQKQYLTVY